LVNAFLDRMRDVSAENDFLERCITSDLPPSRVRPRTRLALGPPRRVIIAHVDALAPHKDEVPETEDAEWDADADNDDLCAARLRLPPRKIRTPHKEQPRKLRTLTGTPTMMRTHE